MPDIIRRFKAPTGLETEQRLIDILPQLLPDLPRTRIKQIIAHKQVMVNGALMTRATDSVPDGAEIAVNLTREFVLFSHRRLRIVYEDDDVIVVDKGYGLLSIGPDSPQRGPKIETAYSLLRDYLKKVDSHNKIFVIHRLDRDTSGLMMFAKNIEAKETMQHNWNNMVLERKYMAVVQGRPESETGTVRSYLNENSRYTVYSEPTDKNGGKLAVTRYQVINSNDRFSLLEVQLDTGRKNQIRVHMADLGCPISGDRKYGPDKPSPMHRLGLHARTLRFVHPRTRQLVALDSPTPAAFVKLTR